MAFMSALTFALAKSRVARAIGGQGGPALLLAAGDAIEEAFNEWNYRKNWNWTMDSLATINVVAGTSDYALSNSGSVHKACYSARLLTPSARTLKYLDQRDYDRAVWDQAPQGEPRLYTELYPSGVPTIRLLPTPAANGTLSVRFFRLMNAPVNDSDTLDVPRKYQNGLLWLAKAFFLADRDAENARTGYWTNKAEAEFIRCAADDETVPDRESVFKPAVEDGTGALDPTMPAYYLQDDGW